jgi:hypothetical protein
MSGFSWIANVHSHGLTEYKFNLTKDGKLNNSAQSLNEGANHSLGGLEVLVIQLLLPVSHTCSASAAPQMMKMGKICPYFY